MNVGIRELKARLSEHVARASRGERIIVTDRGKPVAQLIGLEEESALDRGIEEGWITPPSSLGSLPKVLRYTSPLSVLEVLDEDRGR